VIDKVADVKVVVNAARCHPRVMPRPPISKVMVATKKQQTNKANSSHKMRNRDLLTGSDNTFGC
jgi:hypothetical protein